jgi:cobalamin biosynthetic protein CobC
MIPLNVDEPLIHGGDLGAARRLFPAAPEPFLDLSTGINPNPYPLPYLPAELFARLPDPNALTKLRTVAAQAYGAPAPDHVVAAPGTQILLPLVSALVPPGRAAILGPTYAEHARAAVLAGHAVREVGDLDSLADTKLAVITHPNNPDGRVFARDNLLALAKTLRHRGGLLVVDEAFMDVGPPGASLAGDVARGNIIVLRSFGKFFGLAGLRLGFALAAPAPAAKLAAMLGPWAVSAPASAVGTQALADRSWIAAARRALPQAAARLDTMLARSGVEVIGGTALFRLAQTPAARKVFHHLGRAGILTRAFTERAAWLRFGLPAHEGDWRRLEIAMAAFDGKG